MTMKYFISLLAFFLTWSPLYPQSGNWDTYAAQWAEKLGSVTLDLELIQSAPKLGLPYVVATGITFPKCKPNGLPEKDAFPILYALSDSLSNVMNKTVVNEVVGTFTYQCERLDYFYVNDTMDIRANLIQLYNTSFKEYPYIIAINKDPEWRAYREFLYPKEESLEYMDNQKIAIILIQKGDNLSSPRPVTHYLYFSIKKNRTDFAKQIKLLGYKIERNNIYNPNSNKGKYPYLLSISRTEKPDPVNMSKHTLELKKAAAKLDGKYNTWESPVVK
jgi:Family of unknown function (DUF695)/Regulator of ribonuclease activity B